MSDHKNRITEGKNRSRLTRLVVVKGERSREEFVLGKGCFTIGRAQENDIILDNPSTSRYHARLEYENGHYFITDLGSRNGTRVNGELITIRKLSCGDDVRIGRSIFRFVVGDVTPLFPLYQDKIEVE